MTNKFELAFTNLGTGKFILKTVSNLEEYWQGFKLVNPTGNNDVEVQFLEGDLIGKATEYVEIVLGLLESDIELQDIEAVINSVDTIEEAKQLLNNKEYTLLYEDNKIEAFSTYLKDRDYLHNVPNHIIDYIDYEAMLYDWECDGFNIQRVKEGLYIIIH